MFFARRHVYNDLAEEMRMHLDEKIEELVAAGVPREEAEHQARREFGNATLLEEHGREVWQWPTVESIWADIKFAVRQLRKSPGFAATAILTLALGIGANTAVFSLFDTVLLHPLPYRDPGRLMLVTEIDRRVETEEHSVAAQEALDYKKQNQAFSQMATFEDAGFNLTGNGEPMRINAAQVSSSAFPLLGVAAVLGRTFTADEEHEGKNHIAVLSWRLWKNAYGGDPKILGKVIKLDETPYTVIGVMPASFRFPFDGKPLSEMADVWVPDIFAPYRLDPGNRLMEFGVGLIGRLKPGVSAELARANMTQIADEFQKEHADVYTGSLRIEARTYSFAGYSMKKARPLVVLLMCSVACVLLIACANVANLLLARANHRGREMAIRAAVGANRARLLRQCLVESLLLSLSGAALGVLLTEGILFVLRLWGPQSVPRLHDVTLHPLALAFTLILSLLTGILFGFVPAWRLSHVSPQASLKESAQAGATRSHQRLQNAIAICEVALAIVLLMSGGLLVRSFARVLHTPFGFDPDGTFVVRTLFDGKRYPKPLVRKAAQQEMLARLSHLPGVTQVAAASHLPLSDEREIGFRLEHAAPDDFHWAANSLISPGYFRAMGISLLRGRDFDEHDRPDSTQVAIVSQAFAKQYLSGQDPIGQRFHWGDRALFTIIGVAADVHIAALDTDPPPMVYNSMFQVESGASGRTALILRSQNDHQVLFQEVQKIVWSLDRDLPLYNTTSLATLVSESLAQRRFTILLLGSFAFSAVLLAMIGLFGVLSYLVGLREQEIGVRMALGADRGMILKWMLRKGFALGLAGCVFGLLLATLSTKLLQTSLYHVSRFDPLTLIGVPCLLLIIVWVAVFIPARRAASIDPMQALRSE